MRFVIAGQQPDETRITTEIPPQYKPYIHPFASPVLEESPQLDVLYQVLQADGFTVCNNVFFPKEDVTVTPSVPDALTVLQFMMKGSIRFELNGHGAAWFRAGQFGFFQLLTQAFRGWLEKGAVYETFHIYLRREQLLRLAPHSAMAAELLRFSESGEAVYFQPPPGIMTNRFYEHIQEVRGMPAWQPLREFTIPAYLTLLLNGTLTTDDTPQQGDDDHTLFASIRAYIQHNLGKELGNRELASDYCISVSKLKYGFKRIYNESLQAYVKRSRLEKAKELISSTALPLQRIAQMVGYPDYGNFSRRYHAYFGYPPSELKKQ